ncbi:MAG: Jag N-terminal domain-containing protein [Syntrophorhabdaceae bacterium]|nr:Jag N-terminal domain-containing protein [Syntrophorhabdaceae bacterium]MDD5242950.1 Jag N-terminal domain-containing protein [Syntrophorhabdaceae bacterium]
MDAIEVEGKTYEEAVKKASLALNTEEKDLDIEVTEVDTKGILGLLGSKKVRITAKIREKETTPEDYGKQLLQDLGRFAGLTFNIKTTEANEKTERILFLIQCDDGDVLIGKDGEALEALQHILKLAIAKKYKQNLKILVDINGYREKKRNALTVMAKRLADKVKRTGRRIKTDPLNPYERRIIHTLFKHNKNVTTKSEGEGHTKKVIISPTGHLHHGRR